MNIEQSETMKLLFIRAIANIDLLFCIVELENYYISFESAEENPTIREVLSQLSEFYMRGGNE